MERLCTFGSQPLTVGGSLKSHHNDLNSYESSIAFVQRITPPKIHSESLLFSSCSVPQISNPHPLAQYWKHAQYGI